MLTWVVTEPNDPPQYVIDIRPHFHADSPSLVVISEAETLVAELTTLSNLFAYSASSIVRCS